MAYGALALADFFFFNFFFLAFLAFFAVVADSLLPTNGALACSGWAAGAAGAAGACAAEVNGKPKATADNREIKSLFMDPKFKKQLTYCLISCRDLGAKLVSKLTGTVLRGLKGCLKVLAHMGLLQSVEGSKGGATFGCDAFA